MKTEQVGDSFAARLTGLDIAAGVSAALVAEVQAALNEYPVLCFPDQPLTDDQQTAFVHQLGPAFEAPYGEVARRENNNPRLIDVTSADAEGVPLAKGTARRKFYDANMFWHTDASFAERPMRITALSARILPTIPPDTEFADMRAAWDALSPAMKHKCETIVVEHSMFYSRRRMGMYEEEFSSEFRKDFTKPTRHRLIRRHPATGRTSLYLSSHGGKIVGWSEEDGAAFLDELTAFATQPEFVYAHKWRPHDLVMWDDSCTMHRATPYEGPEPRLMRWTGVLESQPIAV